MTYPPMKRGLDFFFSMVLLLIFLPLMVVVGLLALVLQGRPIFFVQVRPGLCERPFRLVKFRTMSHGNQALDGGLGEKYTTRFGKILRSLSIDELPQLVNILRGDMSFVGPRPLLVEYLPLYSRQQKRRHNVRPGLTGLAQIEGRNQVSWERRLALDVVYTDNQSLALDTGIVLRSVGLVLTRQGVEAEGAEMMPPFRGNGFSEAE